MSSVGCMGGLCIYPRVPRCTALPAVTGGWLGFTAWKHPSPSTAATGPRRSPRSSARTTSPSRCGPRWRTTGSTTPTSSPGPRGCGKTTSRPDPGPRAQLRAGADRRPVRRVRLVPRPRPRRARLDRRHRDRRRLARWCRRRPRPAREGVLRAGAQPLQGLHHRRGAHGLHAGLQRPAQARRGAAGAPAVHLRDHRARQGAADDPVPHPPLPVPADPAAAALRPTSGSCARWRAWPSSRRRCRWWSAPAAARPATPCPCSTSCSAVPGRPG